MRGATNVRTVVALFMLALCLGAGLIGGCSTLPSLENRRTSTALFDTGDTRLGRAISPMVDAHPGVSGIYPLPDARDAFAARALLAQSAERTLDVQYYIWHDFGATDGVVFVDLDVMAVGPVVAEVSKQFDRYWASGSSYPVERLLPAVNPAAIAEITSSALRIERDPAAVAYMNALRNLDFVHEMDQGSLVLDWSATRMISDDPGKGLGLAAPETLLFPKLREIIGESAAEVYMESPYLVPTAAEFDEFAAIVDRGVKIKVLTNSLQSTDVPIVHAGYAKRRKPLLEAGVALYELRRLSPDTAPRTGAGPLGSSGSSLHAKAFSVDNSRVFIGSFNFDPRSSTLNTEMGFVIDSPALANRMEVALSRRFLASAYEVRLSDVGKLYWIERRDAEWVRHDTEPGTSFWRRLEIWLMSMLPIEWLL